MSTEAKTALSVNVDAASTKRHAEDTKHEEAANADNNEPNKKKKKQVKIWCDGCFDMMHYGHANALRQAREEGDYLIVGVHSDAEVLRHKGPPVMTEAERYAAVRGCKWVDEVVEDAPYVTDLEWMDKYGADICVHGEDPSYDENGRDTYWKVKEAGRFRIVKRTQGVSTTDLVGRMLLMTMDHLPASVKAAQPVSVSDDKNVRVVQPGPTGQITPWSSPKSTSFLASSMTLAQFAAGNRSPTESDRIVYIDGAFDLFHVGHIEALRVAKSLGTYLIVGIHDDAIVNQMKGSNLPIMNVHERTLSVLQCRYVDQVITGAPWHITEQVIRQLKISLVVRGAASDYKGPADEECYKVPKEMGIYREFPSPLSNLTTGSIIERILENRKKFQERNQKKVKGEVAFANQIAAQHAEHIAKVDGAKPAEQH